VNRNQGTFHQANIPQNIRKFRQPPAHVALTESSTTSRKLGTVDRKMRNLAECRPDECKRRAQRQPDMIGRTDTKRSRYIGLQMAPITTHLNRYAPGPTWKNVTDDLSAVEFAAFHDNLQVAHGCLGARPERLDLQK
jgi:hypothetical protein